MKILIVDDSKPMRTLLSYLARELGFETTEAEDGCVALSVLQQETNVGLALVDWEMPRMDGLEFVKSVRANASFDGIKLMMVTNQNSMERVATALTAGASDFLMKPVSRDSFEEKLRLLGLIE
jgi:two-component system chemotaxis response regulator CheY